MAFRLALSRLMVQLILVFHILVWLVLELDYKGESMIVVHNLDDSKTISKPFVSTISKDVTDNKISNTEYHAYKYNSGLTWCDPTANTIKDTRIDVVNRARCVDIAMISGGDSSKLYKYLNSSDNINLLLDSPFGNWRNYDTNRFCKLSDRIMLRADALPSMGMDITYSLKSVGDEVAKSGLLSTAKKITEGINTAVQGFDAIKSALTGSPSDLPKYQGEFVSRLANMPIMDTAATTTNGLSSIKFNFDFGQAGLFSAEEEVVKPILALANIYTLQGQNRLVGPYPTVGYAKAEAAGAFIKSLKNVSGAVKGAAESESSLIAGGIAVANAFTESLYAAVDRASAASAYRTSAFVVLLGGAISGPYVPSTIKWDFDFDNVDEYGYPTHGTIEFSGLKSIMLMTGSDIISQWGYKSGKRDANNISAADANRTSDMSTKDADGNAIDNSIHGGQPTKSVEITGSRYSSQ